jgi:hypothetical protein
MLLFSHVSLAQPVPQLHRADFEGAELLAHPETRQIGETCTSHVITAQDRHGGERCEQFLFHSDHVSAENERVVIAVPESRVFNELSTSLWVRTNCSNVRLGVRVRFPHQIDPRTREPLSLEILGDLYTGGTEWQQITCQTTDEALQSRLIRARGQLSDGVQPVRIDEREPYVDRVVLLLQLPQGHSALEIDDLEFGPIVKPGAVVETKTTDSVPPSQLTILDDRIRKNGQPFFPIFTLYHGESLELISRTGVNLLWIRSYLDRPLLSALAGMDIGAIAYPPQPSPEQAILDRAAIPSLPEWTSPIWAWILGFEIPMEDRAYVTAWADQIRDADRQRRPILADVSGDERDFHRHIDFLASSRFAIHTGCSNPDHFEELRGRRDFALPGKPMFTFLQTEASGPMLDYFADRGTMPIVEPEQILHQGYEAIAAGYKGVGFWKQIPFDNDVPGLNERLDAIRIFSIHGRILEPFLATARLVDEIPVQVDDESGKTQKAKTPLASRWDRRVTPAGQVDSPAGVDSNIAATVFHTEHGLLILLVWHEPGAQCVPGPQAAKSVKMLVRGIGDVAQAWEVTPTGIGQKNLTMSRVAGGTELTLEDFDQAAAIIVTSEKSEAEALQPVVRKYRRTAAEAFVQLAANKLTRVTNVHLQLVAVGAPSIFQADTRIQKAQEFLDQARQELAADRMDEARIASQKSLQWLRSLQRAHWEAAIAPLIAPTASLAAASFQTLPEHWRMLTELGQASSISENLLPSGDFESEQSLGQWSDGSSASRFSSLRLAKGIDSGHHLSMLVQGEAPPGESTVLVSPPIATQPGDLVVITGQFRLPHSLTGPGHQFSIFDTMVGRGGAIRLKERTDEWTSFRMIRRVSKGDHWRLRFELEGPGIAELDDVQVRVVRSADSAPVAR